MEDARPIPQFRCDEIEKQKLCKEWRAWKGSLECYFDAYGIEEQKTRRAKLLHLGGPQLQKVFQNLPDRENFPIVSLEKQWYDVAINALDGFFVPYHQDCLERVKLRQIKQKQGERFADFVLRLRQQISDCGFDKYPDETKSVLIEIFLLDAVVEGCQSQELRRRILQRDRPFSEVESLGLTLEGLDSQVKDFEVKPKQSEGQQVFRLSDDSKKYSKRRQAGGFKRSFPGKDKPSDKPKNPITCYNCGNEDHISTSDDCPAKGEMCHFCKRRGHFQPFCRLRKLSKAQGSVQHRAPQATPRKVRAVEAERPHAADVPKEPTVKSYYTFFSGNESNVVLCEVGGVKLDLLVDSGSDVNLIPEDTWKHLKQANVLIHQCTQGSSRVIKGYANDNPLPICGSFVADVVAGSNTCRAEFFVIQGGQRSLLGDRTSKKLGILKVGLNVNQIAGAMEPFPKIKNIQVHIHTDPAIKPVFQPVRRVPIPLEAAVDRKLEQLLAREIIEVKLGPTTWVSPLVVVGKSNGEPRICLDLRRVNKAVLRERHPMPVVEEYLARLGRGKIWSKLDIKDAFLQVELAPESRDVTTFITSKGLFRFKRLPFGLVIAPELFQKVMDQILVGCDGTFWYLDDVIVEGCDTLEHETRLNEVLKRFEEWGVQLNWEKCVFRVTKIEFLGHTISSDGIFPSSAKIDAILSFRRPENEAETRSFLGLANYLNKFIPDLATLDEPLRALTRKGTKFEWTVEHQNSFEKIKTAMSKAQHLGFFNKTDRTALMADASPTGLGALLLQTDTSGNSRIVNCASKSLTDTEKKYCQTEKEALAIVWGVERFYTYLYGSEFDILTDCKALEYLFTVRSRPCARIERWVLRLQTFDYRLIYVPGERNIADVLSRLGTLRPVPFDQEEELFIRHVALAAATTAALSWDEIVSESKNDLEIQQVLECLQQDSLDSLPLPFRVVANELCRCGDVLLRTDRIVIPTVLRNKVLQVAHEGHIGMRMMKTHLRSAVWWPKLDSAVEDFVKRCRPCSLVAAPEPPLPMVRKEMPYGPWEKIAVDFLGPLPEGQMLLVVVDYYSRFIEICEMTQIGAKETILQLSKMFARYGVPLTLRADNGPQFSAACNEFKGFCDDMGIRLVNTIPYWPQQNGEVERQNRSILKRLKIAQELGEDWRMILDKFILSYHSTSHPTTGRSPSELMFGRTIRSKLPQVPREIASDEGVSDQDRLNKEKGRIYANRKRRAQESDIQAGDQVFVKRFRKENKLSTEYSPEEHTVVRRNGVDVTVRSSKDGKEYRRSVTHLKKIPDQSTEDEIASQQTVPTASEPSPDIPRIHETEEHKNDSIGHSKRVRKEPTKFQDYIPH